MSFAHIDEKIAVLHSKREEWYKMDLKGKVAVIKSIIASLRGIGLEGAKRWANDATICMQLDPKNEANDMSTAINAILNLTPLAWLQRVQASFETIIKTGAPPTVPIRTNSTGHTVADVFPFSKNDLRGGNKTLKAELWLKSEKQGGCVGGSTVPEGIAVVLGAGNQGFLTVMDILQCLFIDNEVVLCKHHPLRAYQDGPLRAMFEPLIKAGYIEFVMDEGVSAASHLVHHEKVSHVHMTGGAATHDAIVWGVGEAQAANKAAETPVLKAKMTSELGCVTPYILTPAEWTEEELLHHAMHLAVIFVQNVSCNCNAPKVLIMSETWKQKDQFLAMLKGVLAKLPLGVPYYPGTEKRYQGFAKAYEGSSEQISSFPGAALPDAPAGIPWLFCYMTHDPNNPNPNEYAFRNEAFGPVLAVCTVKAGMDSEFLAAAAPLCNDLLYGHLSATVVMHPTVEKRFTRQCDKLIADLQYGMIAINFWTASTYSVDTCVWGAYPGEKLNAVESGIGFVNNTLLFDDIEKAVVRSEFIDTSAQIGTSTSTTPESIMNTVHFLIAPGAWTLGKMLAPRLGSVFGNVAVEKVKDDTDEEMAEPNSGCSIQ